MLSKRQKERREKRKRKISEIYKSTPKGCKVCGEEKFAHRPDSYFGHIDHAFKK